jgi:carboxymethylenebutenolidase
MPDVMIHAAADLPAYVAVPDGEGPWPGVLVIHDAYGLTPDSRRQADWLASEGFVALAPDLFHRGGTLSCMRTVMRDTLKREGQTFDDLESARAWLADRDDCTGRIGVVGFCMGGGFALMLAPRPGYSAASVNYGMVPKDADELLKGACPVIGSYGAKDWTLRKAPVKLEQALQRNGVAHDVEVYANAAHSFLNDHEPSEVSILFRVVGRVMGARYEESSAQDARRRIVAFFGEHLALGAQPEASS